MEEDYQVKTEQMPSMAETKIEELRHTLKRIELSLKPILISKPDSVGVRDSSAPAASSKLLRDLDELLAQAGHLENRINI